MLLEKQQISVGEYGVAYYVTLQQALEMEKQQTIGFAQTFAIKEADREFLENIYKKTYE